VWELVHSIVISFSPDAVNSNGPNGAVREVSKSTILHVVLAILCMYICISVLPWPFYSSGPLCLRFRRLSGRYSLNLPVTVLYKITLSVLPLMGALTKKSTPNRKYSATVESLLIIRVYTN
jgi:hypothetical protein